MTNSAQSNSSGPQILIGLGDRSKPGTIAHYFGAGRKSLLNMITCHGFPAHKFPDGTWRAIPEEINAWVKAQREQGNNGGGGGGKGGG